MPTLAARQPAAIASGRRAQPAGTPLAPPPPRNWPGPARQAIHQALADFRGLRHTAWSWLPRWPAASSTTIRNRRRPRRRSPHGARWPTGRSGCWPAGKPRGRRSIAWPGRSSSLARGGAVRRAARPDQRDDRERSPAIRHDAPPNTWPTRLIGVGGAVRRRRDLALAGLRKSRSVSRLRGAAGRQFRARGRALRCDESSGERVKAASHLAMPAVAR